MANPDRQSDGIVRAGGMIAAAIVGAAMILSWGSSDDGPRYQIAAVGDSVVRVDTDSGEMLACNRQQCVRVEEGTTERRFGPVGVVVDKRKSQSSLPAPDAPELNQ